MAALDYRPDKTVREFIKHYLPGELFYSFITGPVGSGKTTGLFFKLVYMAKLQKPSPVDGVRRTRAVIVRQTLPQLRDTTINSWNYFFRDGEAGKWHATSNRFVLSFADKDGPVEVEVLFRPLDTADDVARVLSLEISFAIIDEFVAIPREIVDALSARLGRYPSKKDGGCTNWGMWASSNTDNVDCWWYTFLHKELPDNARYFVQPSGFSPDAENLENLPGGSGYYTNQAKGKSEAWVKQFIEGEWGFSISGTPVVKSFKPELHISKKPLLYNPHLPLIFGFDPGLAGTAAVFGQQDLNGRLLILGEVIAEGIGTQRFMDEMLRPYIRRRFPEATDVVCAPDPAASNRSQTDERAVVDVLRKHFTIRSESNNRLPLRLDALDYFTTKLVEGGPAFLVDEKEAPTVVKALRGGWRFAMDTKKDTFKSPEPEKNQWSHCGDALGYLARFFHKQFERELRYGSGKTARFTPPRFTNNGYHFR